MTADAVPLASLQSELARLHDRLSELKTPFESHSMELLHCVVANVPDFIAMLAPDGTILFLNRVREGGPSLEAVLGRSVFDFTSPGGVAAYRAGLEHVVRTAQPQILEQEARLSDGTTAWFETRLEPVRDGDRVIAVIAIATDVSQRKRAARALRESEAKLRLAVDGAGIGLWRWDVSADRVAWEDGLCAIFGRPPGFAPVGREGYLVLIHAEDRARSAERIRGGLVEGSWEDEYRITRPDGEVRWVLVKGSVLREPHGDLVLGAVIDVTDRKRRDEQLRQSQKLEAVGQLTAGIAHNFNNMLMSILPNLELALQGAPPAIAPLLKNADLAAHRAADLVRQLMTFAGRNRPVARRIEALGALVERTVAICRTAVDQRIVFKVRCVPDAHASVDAAQLEQSLINILINARDALLDGEAETPTVQVDVDVVRARHPAAPHAAPSEHVRIRIADNGAGMDAATVARIYEPFFTTKPTGRGTGLGLATTHAIVREHGGWIGCHSTPGVGTSFVIHLPAEGGAVAPVEGAEPASARGSETVLVVDDEPGIRQVVALMLESAGYTVKLAESGRHALELLSDGPTAASVGAILLDVSMPGLPWRELRSKLRALAPCARVVFFTGYAFDAAEAEDTVLEKPVTQARLLATLRQVLDRGRQERGPNAPAELV